jgi:hypothetical protein
MTAGEEALACLLGSVFWRSRAQSVTLVLAGTQRILPDLRELLCLRRERFEVRLQWARQPPLPQRLRIRHQLLGEWTK